MKLRIMCGLLSDTEAHAIEVRDAVVSDLVGKSVQRSQFDVFEVESSMWLCNGDVEFNSDLDGTIWFDQVIAQWTTGPLAGNILGDSRLHRHNCPHPDNDTMCNCHDDVLALFVEQVKI